MNVMFSVGPNTMRLINTTISKQIDNIDCLYFASVDEFIQQSQLRRLVFNRIVFSQKFISTEEDMKKLCDYVHQNLSTVEIVMILKKEVSSYEYIFKKYFDSPLYTLMYMERVTARCMLDSVKLPIVDIKAKYYMLESKSVDGSNLSGSDVVNSELKNNRSFSQIENSSQEPSLTTQNPTNSGLINYSDEISKSVSDITLNSTTVGNDSDFDFPDKSKIFESFSDTSASHGEENAKSDFSNFSSDDMDLSVGDFGSQHSDSGFVGDDELDELEQFNASRDTSTSDTNSTEVSKDVSKCHDVSNPTLMVQKDVVRGVQPSESRIQKETTSERIVHEVKVSNKSSEGNKRTDNVLLCEDKINIVTGLNGSGVTAFIAIAADKYAKEGKKVLILDLDSSSNGILSFIDVKKFYSEGYNDGFNKKRVYSEDGIDIMSNGYGTGSPSNIDKFLGDSVFKKYDLVLVDCPIDSLNLIGDSVFCSSNVVMCTITDVSKLVETSGILYDRRFVSLLKEVHISKNCKVANRNISKDSIAYVKDVCLFTNGCWLDNVKGVKGL